MPRTGKQLAGSVRSGARTRRRCVRAIAVALVVVTTSTALGGPSSAESIPKGKKGTSSGVVPPPIGRVDPTSPAVGLRRVVQDLERMATASEDRSLVEAVSRARTAADQWSGDRPDVPTVVSEIGAASQALQDSAVRDGSTDEIRRFLASIARHIAVNINAIVGPGPDGDSGRRAIATGDEHAASGDSEGAINAYLQASRDFAILTFNPLKFRVNIEKQLTDGDAVNAAAWAIAVNGEVILPLSTGFGRARHPIDKPALTFTAHEQMNIGSVSKNVTATAAVKLLNDLGIDYDAKIAEYLPPDWEPNAHAQTVTFRELLTHTSGLAANTNPSDAYKWLKTWINVGGAGVKNYRYQNINLAMFRVLIPWMWESDKEDFSLAYAKANATKKGELTQARFEEFAQEEILAPLGITFAQCGPIGNPTLAYTFPWDGTAGVSVQDKQFCGGGAWHFTAYDLAALAAKRQFGDLLAASAKAMKQNYFGYGDPANGTTFATGAFGTYYGHGGDRSFGAQEFHACLMEFPNGVHASLFLNSDTQNVTSQGIPSPYQCDRLKAAYEAAWEIKK